MKLLLIAFAVIAAVAADVSHLPSNEYLPPAQDPPAPVAAPSNEYLAPAQEPEPAHELDEQGYRYKTHRRVVYRRHRRDASHVPSSDYLPPAQDTSVPSNEYLPPVQQDQPAPAPSYKPAPAPAPVPAPAPSYQPAPVAAEPAPAHVLADDGYRYKTRRRVVYRRHRRDASHVPSSDYLPPAQDTSVPSNEYLPPVQQDQPAPSYNPAPAPAPAPVPSYQPAPAPAEPAPAHVLADDGYRYKTRRRVVYRRHRRDASHVPSSDYLPPAQDTSVPSNEYLPPAQQDQPAPAPSYNPAPAPAPVPAPAPSYQPAPVAAEPAPAHVLADDGYRYKTRRRVVYRRHRRDASHVPSNEYLPPVQDAPAPVAAPSNEYLAPAQEPEPAHELDEQGYRYKTHRRVVYRRHRRDVSHLPSNEYLPPVEDNSVSVPSNDYLPPVQQSQPAPAPAPVFAPVPAPAEPAPAHVLADDGYRYKSRRRVVYRRHRRDASHVPSNEYLPPAQDAPAPVAAPSNEYLAPAQEPEPAHELDSTGYRYKTHRRVVYRRH